MPAELVNVLLVDDEADFLSAMGRALARRGFNVLTATCAEEARSVLGLNEIRLAIVDVKLPDADGHDLVLELKGRPPGVEFMILTGHGDLQKACEAGALGVFAYLANPCDPDDLAGHIRRTTGTGQRAPEAVRRVAGTDHAGSAPEAPAPATGVLLVDDEPESLTSMKRVLARRGLDVFCAGSGDGALRLLAAAPVRVAVVDLRMPQDGRPRSPAPDQGDPAGGAGHHPHRARHRRYRHPVHV